MRKFISHPITESKVELLVRLSSIKRQTKMFFYFWEEMPFLWDSEDLMELIKLLCRRNHFKVKFLKKVLKSRITQAIILNLPFKKRVLFMKEVFEFVINETKEVKIPSAISTPFQGIQHSPNINIVNLSNIKQIADHEEHKFQHSTDLSPMEFHDLMNSSFKGLAQKNSSNNQQTSTSDDSMNYSHLSSPNGYTVKTIKICNDGQILKLFVR